MTSIRDLACEYKCQEDDIRAFWPDAMNLMVHDTDEIPADMETAFRQAWETAPELQVGD
jgi:hypothetical protein